MPEESKPEKTQISLEDIANSSASFMRLGELANNPYAAKVHGFYNHLQLIGGNPDEIEAARHYTTNPYNFSLDVEHQANAAKAKSLEDVESGLDTIVGKLDQNSLSALALEFGLKDKKYLTLTRATKLEDHGAIVKLVREDYLERNKDRKELVDLAKTWGQETWIGYAGYEQSRMQQEFVKKKLYTTSEIEKDGKKQKETKYDATKAKSFLLGAVRGLKGEEKEAALLELGKIAQAIVAQEKDKKEKEAKKK